MKIFKSYYYIIIINLLILLIILYIILSSIFNWLKLYTNRDNYVIVPNLYALNIEKAKYDLKKLGLNYDINISRYNSKFKPHHVFNFIPKIGYHVKPGRTIFIQANGKSMYKYTRLPNIIYKNKIYAFTQISSKHLLINKITYIPNVKEGLIIKILYNGNSIKSGKILPYKSKLDLFIGQGYN